MNKEKKVSVIVPVYGVEKWVGRCAESLMTQSLSDYELIFLDDCTPDKSIEIIKKTVSDLKRSDVSVKFIRNEQNLGVNPTREKGLYHAQGKYILFVDADDILKPDMLRELYQKSEAEGLDACLCDYVEIYPDNKERIFKAYFSEDKSRLISNIFTIKNSTGVLWNKFFRKEILTKDKIYFPANHFGEDLVVTVQCLVRANKIGYLPKAMYGYMQRPGSVVNSQELQRIKSNRGVGIENWKLAYDIVHRQEGYKIEKVDSISGRLFLQGMFEKEICASKGGRREWVKAFEGLLGDIMLSRDYNLRFKLGYLRKWLKYKYL